MFHWVRLFSHTILAAKGLTSVTTINKNKCRSISIKFSISKPIPSQPSNYKLSHAYHSRIEQDNSLPNSTKKIELYPHDLLLSLPVASCNLPLYRLVKRGATLCEFTYFSMKRFSEHMNILVTPESNLISPLDNRNRITAPLGLHLLFVLNPSSTGTIHYCWTI